MLLYIFSVCIYVFRNYTIYLLKIVFTLKKMKYGLSLIQQEKKKNTQEIHETQGIIPELQSSSTFNIFGDPRFIHLLFFSSEVIALKNLLWHATEV